MAYNKQTWKDEIPDLTKPIKDASGKQKTDPQTGRSLYELVQEGTRITSARLNHIEDGIEGAHSELADLSENVETHMSDDVKHLTAAERTVWNTKETPAGAQQKADASLASAKSYTETQLLTKADKSTTYSKTETDQRIKAVIGAAPEALDTLKEIGDALNNDPNFAATMTTQLSGKVDKISGKQLSTEDFSTAEKTKLAGLTSGAGGAGSATDLVIGDRTLADAGVEPTGTTGKLGTVLNWLAYMIRSITGKASWRTAPATTLEAAATHNNDNVRHITATERTGWNAKANKSLPLPTNADLNTYLNEGSWVATTNAVAATITNRPSFGDYAFNLTVKTTVGTEGSGSGCNQTITFYRTDLEPPKMFTRNCYLNVWSPWVAIETAVGSQSKADAAQAAAIAYTDTKVGRVDLTQTLGPGTSILTADQNGSDLDLVVQGQTRHNIMGNIGNFEVDSNGDGLADGFTTGYPATYSRVAGKYGAFAQRITSAASDTSTDRRVSKGSIAVPAGKYVVIADGMTDGTNGRIGISVYNNGPSLGVTTPMTSPSAWKPVFTKFTLATDTTQLALHFYNTATAGAVGWAQYDGAGLYQVDDALYARIGVDITEANIRDYFPHVDGKQHVQGIAVTKQGRNLLPPFLASNFTMNNVAVIFNGDNVVIPASTGAGTFIMSSNDIGVQPIAYTLSADSAQTYRFIVRLLDASGALITAATGMQGFTYNTYYQGFLKIASTVTFTPPEQAKAMRIGFGSFASDIGGVPSIVSKAQLELGSAATPFTPAEPQSVILPVTLGQIGDVRDSVYSAGTEWMYVERVKKNVLLDGYLEWVIHNVAAGYKVLRVLRFNAAHTADYRMVGRVVKYDGKLLPGTIDPVVGSGADVYRQLTNDTFFYLNVASSDTGWSDALNPSTNAVRAAMNGWKAAANNGTAYTSWVSILDGSAPATNTEAWVSANKAPGWTAWAMLDYVLAQAAAPVPVPNAEGSITLHPGGNQISMETGVIQREKVVPKLDSGNYYIISQSSGSYWGKAVLSRPTQKFLAVFKGAENDTRNWIFTPDGLGAINARALPANFDTSADYYVTYIALDKYALTANVTETAATWRTGLGGVVSDVVQSVAELRQDNDRQDFADDYIEAKVDNLRLGIADTSALPDSIQKYKLTEKTGKPFVVTSGSADVLTSTGLYYISTTSNVSGFPTDVATNTAVTLEVLELGVTSSNKSCLQRVTAYASVRVWQRRYNGTDWTAWVESENGSKKNVAWGYAGLDGSGDVSLTAIPDAVQKYSLTKDDGKALTLAAGTDLNTLLTIGFYTGNNLLNSPGGSTLWFHILVQTHSGATDGTSYVVQRAISLTDAGTPTEWIRRRVTSNWTAWVSIPNSSLYNAANGIAGLDANGDLLLTAIPDAVLQGTVSYLGTLAGNSPNFTGSANPPISALAPGQRLSFKALQSTSGPITLNVNGLGAKSIKKPNGNNPPLVQGGVYTVVYDGTAFILQGEGGEYGTATAEHVLEDYTLGTESGVVQGTIPQRANSNLTSSLWTDPNGGRIVVGFPLGAYLTTGMLGKADVMIQDENFSPENIRSDKSIFGLQGAMPVITDGADPAQGVGLWGDGALAVYPREGYRKGGPGAGEIKVSVAQLASLGLSRSVSGTQASSQLARSTDTNGYTNDSYLITTLPFIPKIVVITTSSQNVYALYLSAFPDRIFLDLGSMTSKYVISQNPNISVGTSIRIPTPGIVGTILNWQAWG